MATLRVAAAQTNPVVGDLDGNVAAILDAMAWAESHAADVLLLPELAVCGYPPEDLVLRQRFLADNVAAIERLAGHAGAVTTIVGFVEPVEGDVDLEDAQPRHAANAVAVIHDGKVAGVYRKVLLPNYAVFDEARYFVAGDRPDTVWTIGGAVAGISICEDIWGSDGPPRRQAAAGAQILLNVNGSPYHAGKGTQRAAMLADVARTTATPLVYLNMAGGQDELVYDGDSMVFDADGHLLHRAAQFVEDRFVIDVPLADRTGGDATFVSGANAHPRPAIALPPVEPRLDPDAEIYQALTVALGDYVHKNGFDQVLIGMSGGIDSAVTAAIAVDALGPDRVWGVTMPSRYSSTGSWQDSETLARNLGCRIDVVAIEDVFAGFLETLAPSFAGTEPGLAEENLQARIRGTILMSLSNKYGPMVITTGNKSEMAVGYATLYGDMAGGYAILKDVLKTQVYRLARWRNRNGEVIPTAIIDKPPSAELRPDQKDSDSLPDYDLLDRILVDYIEQDRAPEEIIADDLDPALVERVVRMVDLAEYKRRQSPPGARITTKAFGKDRRLPITNAYGRRH